MSTFQLGRLEGTFPNANTLGEALRDKPDWLLSAIERFDAKWIESADGCHIWTSTLNERGYGKFRVLDRILSAHRFAFEVHFGAPLTPGLVLDHLCRVRHCVNPAHMEAVPQVTNIRRGLTGQAHASKTHCPRNHEYTIKNTYINPTSGGRVCRACGRERTRARRALADTG